MLKSKKTAVLCFLLLPIFLHAQSARDESNLGACRGTVDGLLQFMKSDGKGHATVNDLELFGGFANFIDGEIVRSGIDVNNSTRYRKAFDVAAMELRERTSDYSACMKSTNSADSYLVCWQQRTLNGRTGALLQENCRELMQRARSR